MITSGSAAGLEYDLAHREGVGDGSTVVLLLHGRGSHKGDLQALASVLPTDWTLVTPQAPYPGTSWGYGPGWAWYRYVEQDRVVTETLEHSLSLLDDFLDGLAGVVGFLPNRIVIGGFSQGGTTSLAFALSRPGLLAGALNFSGFLAAHLDMPNGEAATGATPVFWGHGVRDANIPILLAERGRTRLRDAGVPLVARDYPIGHWMVPEEVQEAVALVESGAD